MADFDRLLADYLVAADEQAGRMQALARSPGPLDLVSLRLSAHRLRGSGQSFGFPEITRIAARIEDLVVAALAGDAGPDAPLASLCDDLGGEVARARGSFGPADEAGRPTRDHSPDRLRPPRA
jgi:HPt (histidine-containing phosphotransfer) domain-containing protein